MITDPWFYAAAVPGVLIAGISKGGFGGGVGIVAVPLMTLVISPIHAAAIMLPILCLMDLIGTWGYRKRWHRPNMGILMLGALLGIVIGAVTFRWVDENTMRVVVGVLAAGFPIYQWSRLGEKFYAKPPGRKAGFFWSTMSGFTSFIIHAGMPPFAIYLVPQKLDRTIFVGTTVIFFAFVNYAKLPPYQWLGLLGEGNLLTSLALMPVAVFGVLFGMWVHHRVPVAQFYHWIHCFLLVIGLKLLYDGARPLLFG